MWDEHANRGLFLEGLRSSSTVAESEAAEQVMVLTIEKREATG